MLRGLTTVTYFANDVDAAAAWYAQVLDAEPYFRREGLIALGATAHEQPVERGPGFVTASVVDPFRNVLGIMFNQHYLDVLTSKATA